MHGLALNIAHIQDFWRRPVHHPRHIAKIEKAGADSVVIELIRNAFVPEFAKAMCRCLLRRQADCATNEQTL